MGNPAPAPHSGSDDDITKVGALSDGYANTATNSTEVDDSATGYVGAANGDNRNNDYDSKTTNTDNSTDIDAKVDVAIGNGDDRNNDYDWSYDSKTSSYTDNDTTQTSNTTTTNTDNSDYDWSYDSKTSSYNDNDTKTVTDTDTDINTVTDNDTDIKTTTDTDTTTNSHNSSESYYKTDTDFAVLDDVKDFDNLGIAGRDLTFNLGDDFSFTLDVDSILNGSLNGEGNDTGFSVIQANHLADQDTAYDIKMNNDNADNNLKADGGSAWGAEGVDMDGKGWDLSAGDDVSGTSTANASAILANSGFHMELVQGANMLSNAVDSTIAGGNTSVSDIGQDSDGS